MQRHSIGSRVRIVRASDDTGRTGTVVGGSMWNADGADPGDRTVQMEDTGERLVFQVWMLESADEDAELATDDDVAARLISSAFCPATAPNPVGPAFRCSLADGHAGPQHEDHLIDQPSVWAWDV